MTNLDTDEQLLSSSMHRRVDLLSPDLDRLVGVATAQGGRIRRRRRAAVGIAAAACVGVGGVVLASLPLGSPSDDGSGGDRDVTSAPPAAVETSPLRTRSLTAALLERVTAAVPGSGTDFRGQDDHALDVPAKHMQANASFRFTPAATGDQAWVSLGVQVTSPVPRHAFDCAERQGSGKHDDGSISHCVRTVLPDGTIVLTWDEIVTQADGTTLVTRAADALRVDDVRVSARASNTPEQSDSLKGSQTFTVTGDPALSHQQLRDLVAWPTWGPELPDEYDAAGNALDPFADQSQVNMDGTLACEADDSCDFGPVGSD